MNKRTREQNLGHGASQQMSQRAYNEPRQEHSRLQAYCPQSQQHFAYPPQQQPAQLPSQQQQQLPPRPVNGESGTANLQELWQFVSNLQAEVITLRSGHASLMDELVGLRHANVELNKLVDFQREQICQLGNELEALDQYSRRENVCFTNLLVDETHTCEQQVVNLCCELGVDVKPEDLVAAHPLKGKKGKQGKPTRYIARFKDRSTAQQVFKNRKLTKNIDPSKKSNLFANPDKGVGVQPNITAKRAALLGQVNDAVKQNDLNACWIDYKNGNVLLRVNSGGNPKLIRNTQDLLVAVPQFKPKEFLFCVSPFFAGPDSFSP